jgi:hypothetical protein
MEKVFVAFESMLRRKADAVTTAAAAQIRAAS